MKIKVQWRNIRCWRGHGILKWVQRSFFVAGCVALGLCALAYVRTWLFQEAQSRKYELTLPPVTPASPRTPARIPLREGESFSRIDIPRIDLSAVVVEGATAHSLELGAGHIPGTALPGESGNVGIAGHRDTIFRKLRKIRDRDVITLTTMEGTYQYAVEWTRVVPPTDVAVLQASGEPVLTLVTCYPFYYVGPAPKRFIVRAREITPQTKVW